MILGPFRATVEIFHQNKFYLESSQLSKNVQYLKIGHTLAKHFIKMGCPRTFVTFYFLNFDMGKFV